MAGEGFFQRSPGNTPNNWFFHYSSSTELEEDLPGVRKAKQRREGRDGGGILDTEYIEKSKVTEADYSLISHMGEVVISRLRAETTHFS